MTDLQHRLTAGRSPWLLLRAVAVLAWLASPVAAGADCVPISSAPYTVEAPGSYCLANDITYLDDDWAITVATDGATIDLNGFTIRGRSTPEVQSAAIVGIRRSGIVVQNGRIEGFARASFSAGTLRSGPSSATSSFRR